MFSSAPTTSTPSRPQSPELYRWFARQSGPDPVAVHGLGVREWMAPGMVNRPHGTNDWLLMVFHQLVLVEVGGQLVEAPVPALLVWPPGDAHRYGWRLGTWCHSWLHLAGGQLAVWAAELAIPLGRPIAGLAPERLEHACREIAEEVGRPEPDGMIIANAINSLLRHAARAAADGDMAPMPAGLVAVRRHLEEHYAGSIRLADLARRCNWTTGHFCAKFKVAFGCSAYEYALRLRLVHAEALLADRNRSVAEVARLVGYADVRTFARLAKRRWGVSPREKRSKTLT